MSKKEKNLLLLLLVVVLFWLYYKFIFIPQSAKIEVMVTEKENIETQLKMIEEIISKEEALKLEEENLKSNIYKKYQKYYYNMDQPDLMHILNTIIEDCELEISSMSFTQPTSVDSEGLERINKVNITLPLRGDYAALELFLHKLQSTSKKLLVDYLSISRDVKGNAIIGQISLVAFSYGDEKTSEADYYYINAYSGSSKANPFEAFDDFSKKIEVIDNNEYFVNEEKRNLIYDMESDDIYFMGTSPEVTGEIIRLNNGKYGKTSIRAEYFISTDYKSERAYIVLDDKNISMKYPPQSIGIWAYGYGYSPIIIGMRFQDPDGRKIDMKLSEGVNWIGWQYISATPPQDINLYPLKLDRLYFELDANRNDYGVILFDQIEANYQKSEEAEAKQQHNYVFYVVKPGDTLRTISKKFYNTESNYIKLAKDNGLDVNSELKPGKVLVIAQ